MLVGRRFLLLQGWRGMMGRMGQVSRRHCCVKVDCAFAFWREGHCWTLWSLESAHEARLAGRALGTTVKVNPNLFLVLSIHHVACYTVRPSASVRIKLHSLTSHQSHPKGNELITLFEPSSLTTCYRNSMI